MVLAPIDPVAPRSVTVRSRGLDAGRSKAAREVSGVIDSPYQQAPSGRLEAAARQSDERRDDTGGHEAVEPVHQAAMSRDEMTRILGPEPALEDGFEDVAGLRGHRQQDRE